MSCENVVSVHNYVHLCLLYIDSIVIVSQTHQFINTEVLPVTIVKWRCAKHHILATKMGSPRLGGASAGKWMDGAADQVERTSSPTKRWCCRPLAVRTQAPHQDVAKRSACQEPGVREHRPAVRTSSPAIGRCCGPPESLRHCPDEGHCTELCLVAGVGWGPRDLCQELPEMSIMPQHAGHGTTPPVALAFAAMATHPCGLCRSSGWKNVVGHCGCSF